MSTMFRRAGDWWSGRELRERALLGLLAVLVVGLAYWYGAVRPLESLAAAGAERHRRAVAALGQARTLDATMRVQQATERAAVSDTLLQRTAETAGVVIGPIEPERQGDLAVSIEAVGVKPLFGWISTLQRDGVGVRRFEAHQGEDGDLQVRIVFVGRAQ
jgi:type II secretory pathway component PulM